MELGSEKEKCCGQPMKKIYQFKLLMKDASLEHKPKVFEAVVVSYDGNPDYFFPSVNLQGIKFDDPDPKLKILEKVFNEMHFHTGNEYEFIVQTIFVKDKIWFRVVDSIFLLWNL